MRAANSNKLKQARRLRKAGKLEQAVAICNKLLKRSPQCGPVHFELARIYDTQRRFDRVIDHCNQAIESGLHSAEVFATNAAALNSVRNHPDAETMARAAITLDSSDVPAMREMVRSLLPQGKQGDALPFAQQLVARSANNARDRISLAWTLVSLENYDAAIAQGNKALELDSESAEAHYLMSRIYRVIQQWEKAQEMADAAVALAPTHPEYLAMKADMLEHLGEHEQAFALVTPLVNQDPPASVLAVHVYARLARRFGKQKHALDLLKAAADNQSCAVELRQVSLNLLATTYDALGEYDQAFAAVSKANAMRRNRYDDARLTAFVQQISDSYPSDEISKADRRESAADEQSITPIFIVGMPRSGTSLTEKILSRHPRVYAGGETIHLPMMLHRDLPALLERDQQFPDYMAEVTDEAAYAATTAYFENLRPAECNAGDWLTDKRPMNYMYLGAIACLFPHAKIIHCTRDPLDNGLSCYLANFASSSEMGFTQDLELIGRYYRRYQQMMLHWQAVLPMPILDLSYEALVTNPQLEIPKLLEFCGLPWDDACLSPDRATSVTTTASYEQVRQPINTRSIGRWKLYDRHLEPLKQALGLTDSQAA